MDAWYLLCDVSVVLLPEMAGFNVSYVWQGEKGTGNKQMYVQHSGHEVAQLVKSYLLG